MSKLYDLEKIIKGYSTIGLTVVESRYGVDFKIFRVVDDAHTEVYNIHAGEENLREFSTFTGVVLDSEDFTVTDDWGTGFNGGILVTSSDKPMSGDRIQLLRDDNLQKRYQIKELESIGTTKVVFRQFKLSSIGD